MRQSARRPALRRGSSALEEALAAQLAAARVPAAEREHRFAPPRRWRFDFAWPAAKVAVEVEGGLYTLGRHVRPAGYAADCEKYNEAQLRGWRVLRVTEQHIRGGDAVSWVRRALAGANDGPRPAAAETLAVYPETAGGRRSWQSVGTWLYPGDAIAVIRRSDD